MLFWLLQSTVFTYTSTRMLLAATTALIISLSIGPYFIRKLYQLKIGQNIRTDECPKLGQLHKNKQNTPTMGGILILFAMFFSILFWMPFNEIFTFLLVLPTLGLALIGGIDDYLKLSKKNTKGLPASKKLFYQTIIAAMVASYLLIPSLTAKVENLTNLAPPLIRIEKTAKPLSLQAFSSRLYFPFSKKALILEKKGEQILVFLLIIFVIVGSSNAVNLTDGLDGLAIGCVMIVAATLALFAFFSNHREIADYLNIPYIEGSGEIAVYLSAFLGASLGFLWYNGPPAQVFMGDIGSLSLGGVLGIAAVLLKKELLLAILGGVFVAEAFSVILQVLSYRYRNKRRIFLCAPLHHHFEYQGFTETKIVIRFWIIGFLLAMISIASLKF